MRKRLIDPNVAPNNQGWMVLGSVAQVEITSEDAAHPIESALAGEGSGWRASQPGEQVIRLVFDEPVSLKRIYVRFVEDNQSRTQEFVLGWSSGRGGSYREIVRQQYTFSPHGTAREVEDYAVHLSGVSVLELRIVPDIGGGPARASLQELRLA
jgi:hypothetical protein